MTKSTSTDPKLHQLLERSEVVFRKVRNAMAEPKRDRRKIEELRSETIEIAREAQSVLDAKQPASREK